jgi:hypothetical protein
VPQGVLNYQGKNYVAVTLWAQEAAGAKLGGLELEVDAVVQSGMKQPRLIWDDSWEERNSAY